MTRSRRPTRRAGPSGDRGSWLMTRLQADGWKPVTAGELDRLQARLRWRRWLRHAVTAAVVTVVTAAAGLGAVRTVNVVWAMVAPPGRSGPGCCPPPQMDTPDSPCTPTSK